MQSTPTPLWVRLNTEVFSFPTYEFNDDSFDPTQFVNKYRHRTESLHALHQELETFLSYLKEEIVRIINEDYNKFIQFTTQLAGVQQSLSKVENDFPGLYKQVEEFNHFLNKMIRECEEQVNIQKRAKRQKAISKIFIKSFNGIKNLHFLLDETKNDPNGVTYPNIANHYKILSEMYKNVKFEESELLLNIETIQKWKEVNYQIWY